MRIELQPAFVLHTRPYRDTSLLVDFFTPNYGRITAVARGVRKPKARTRALLNPFNRLLISLQGKSDLKLLTAVEADNCCFNLRAEHLYSGFYINELLMRILRETEAQQALFDIYQINLKHLQDHSAIEPILRNFELDLLGELGYGIDFQHDALTGDLISAAKNYHFIAQQGFNQAAQNQTLQSQTLPNQISLQPVISQQGRSELVISQPKEAELIPVVTSMTAPTVTSATSIAAPITTFPSYDAGTKLIIPGLAILAIAERNFSAPETKQYAKYLSRLMLKPLLGNRPLNSRNLFLQPRPKG